jgi:diguanylate cyclase (GGDEF)-like protein
MATDILSGILSSLDLPTAASLVESADLATIAQLQFLAYMDALTGIPNRRSFDLFAPVCGDAAFIFVDLDDLKAKNQALGHLGADAILASVGQTMARHMKRSGDRTFRFGGDEFVAILPNCSLLFALDVAENIRGEVEFHGGATVSIGVAWGGGDWKERFERGDRAAKMAKSMGKNQVVVG